MSILDWKPRPKVSLHLRGFASMKLEERKRIASMGGKAVPKEKRAYSVNRDLAASAGKKGGSA